jgi:RNA polymerase sigma-32 factor
MPQKAQSTLQTLTPLQLYMREIAKYPLLTPEEEFDLASKHVEQDDISAAHRLVTSNLRLVVKIANDFKQSRTFLLDLIQEGNAGLMQAVKRFNPYKGVKLSTYAAWWIKAYILKYILENRSQIKIATTAAQKRLFFNLQKETEKLLAQYDHADVKLLAANLDVKESEVVEMQKRLSSHELSLDAPTISGTPQAELIASDRQGVDDVLADYELQSLFSEHLEEFKKTLKERDFKLLHDRLLAENPKTLQEIGDEYGITRERARQLEANVIQKLRTFVEKKGIIALGD